jgi:membrane-associated protease RseP (regulator of RpoE activity)
MEERMGFGRMTAFSAVTALIGASGLFALAPAAAGQEKRVIVSSPRVVVQDDAQDRGGRKNVIVRTGRGEGPGFDVFDMGGAHLGVVVRDVETSDVTKDKLAGQAGAVVVEVRENSAAAKAGVKTGDVVTSFDGERVRSARQLERLVEETPAGRTVKMALSRAGAATSVEVTPEAPKVTTMFGGEGGGGPMRGFSFNRRVPGPDGDNLAPPEPPQEMPREFRFEMPAGRTDLEGEGFPFVMAGRGRLGVRVQDLSEDLAAYFGVKTGVLVSGVDAETPAAKAGIKAGDVITAVNGQSVAEPGDLRREMAKVDDGKTVDLAVTRDKKGLALKAEMTPRDRTIERKMRRSL